MKSHKLCGCDGGRGVYYNHQFKADMWQWAQAERDRDEHVDDVLTNI